MIQSRDRDQTSTIQELKFKLKGQKTYSMKLYQKIYPDLWKQFLKIKLKLKSQVILVSHTGEFKPKLEEIKKTTTH